MKDTVVIRNSIKRIISDIADNDKGCLNEVDFRSLQKLFEEYGVAEMREAVIDDGN